MVQLGAVQTAAADKPDVELSIDKSVYVPREDIYATITVTPSSNYTAAVSVEYWISEFGDKTAYELSSDALTHTGKLTAPTDEGTYNLKAKFTYLDEKGNLNVKESKIVITTKVGVAIPEFATIAIPASIALLSGLLFMRRKED